MNYYNSYKLDEIFKDENLSTYIIAEIGINHNGNFEEAIKLIDASIDAKVDAVKFQKRDLESIYSKSLLDDSNTQEWNFEYIIPLLKDVELSDDEYIKIRNYCNEKKIDLIITPFDAKSAKFVGELGVSAFKISSADMTNIELVQICAKYKKPLLISTGMWEDNDISECASFYKSQNINYSFLLAQSTYPAPYENLNLKYFNRLKELSGSNVVGYSGHERGVFIPVACVAMGYKIIEKHITFDKMKEGPDHKASMYPQEFKEMVSNIRDLESALSSEKKVNQAELQNKEIFAKSAVAKRDLPIGHVLIKSDIVYKSPGKGIFPHKIYEYFGKIIKNEIKKEHYISESDFKDIVKIKDWKKFNFSQNWGAKCRFHDYDKYKLLNSKVVEFHCSETDLSIDFIPSEISKAGLIIHAPEIFDRKLVDICSSDEAHVNKSLKILQKTLDKTQELSKYFVGHKPKVVMHLGGMFLNDKDVKNTDILVDVAIKNFHKLKYDKNKIDVIAENLPPRPWYLGGEWFQHAFMSSRDMLRFCNHFNLKMTYDICHAQLYCNLFNIDINQYTKDIMPIVSHVHISDAYGTNGEGVQIGEGCMDFDSLFEIMGDYKFSWVPEIWSGHLHEGAGTYECMKVLELKYSKML